MTEQDDTIRLTLAGTPEEIKQQLTQLTAQYQLMQQTGDNYYAIPCESFHQTVRIYPQIALVFKEPKINAQENNRPRHPLRSVVTVRYLTQSYPTPLIKTLASKIANSFAKPPFSFERGREFFSYTDRKLGYFFQVYVKDELNARKIIERAMGIQDHNPDWDLLKRHEQKYKNWDNRDYVQVGDERYKTPNLRPKGTVRFTHAEFKIPGVTEDTILVDRMGQFPNPMVIA